MITKIETKLFFTGVLGFALFGVVSFAAANPSFFIRANAIPCGAFTATTTTSFMTPGAGTTTATFDTGCGTAGSTDNAVLLTQFTASSTASILNISYEYSQDNVDWYQSNLSSQATTSSSQSLTAAQSYSWVFASTTPGGGGSSATGVFANRQMKVIEVRTPTRYVRAIFSTPLGSANDTVWAEFVAKRQAAN